ncbi:MAG: glycosyltransferase [Gemmatimonadota bacterium]
MDNDLLEYGFWALTLVVVYVYAGYPLIAGALASLRRRRPIPILRACPRVSLLFCVHNEAEVLEEKLRNCLALEYPKDRLEILAASDGSDDGSAEMLEQYRRRGLIRANIQKERTGKSVLLNRTVSLASGEILVFTDASTLLRPDALVRHARHYADETVGCVGGDLEFLNTSRSGVSAGHGLYWRYESWIRRNESDLGILAYVPGANYSLRRSVWKEIPADFADDCVSPLNVVAARRRVLYDPEIVAQEVATETPSGLLARRIRMVTRDLEATLKHRFLLNPFRYGGVSFSLASHKLLRWFVPVALPLLFVLSCALIRQPVYLAAALLQATFYTLAALGLFSGGRLRSPFLSVPLYFCVSNLGALIGLVNVLMGRHIGRWQPVGAR